MNPHHLLTLAYNILSLAKWDAERTRKEHGNIELLSVLDDPLTQTQTTDSVPTQHTWLSKLYGSPHTPIVHSPTPRDNRRGKKPAPSEDFLRRAISTGYYALYHAILNAAINATLNRGINGKSPMRHTAFRMVDHSFVKKACQEFNKAGVGGMKLEIRRRMADATGIALDNLAKEVAIKTAIDDLKEVAALFINAMTERHHADYDRLYKFSVAGVETSLDNIAKAIHVLENRSNDQTTSGVYEVFFSIMLFDPQQQGKRDIL